MMQISPSFGKPIGLFQNRRDVAKVTEIAHKIMDSTLTSGQVIDAMKTFLYPALNYQIRTAQVSKTSGNNLNKSLSKKYKKILNLPDNASTNYLHGHTQDGFFGISIAEEVQT